MTFCHKRRELLHGPRICAHHMTAVKKDVSLTYVPTPMIIEHCNGRLSHHPGSQDNGTTARVICICSSFFHSQQVSCQITSTSTKVMRSVTTDAEARQHRTLDYKKRPAAQIWRSQRQQAHSRYTISAINRFQDEG
jgi:hypothetical protein